MTDADAFLSWLETQDLPRTPPYECPYLENRQARQFGFASDRLPAEIYHELMDRGYRRSGRVFYAMDCPSCRSCEPLRVPTSTFRPSRSQRRVLQRNQDVTVDYRTPEASSESYDLYLRYLRHQHPDTPQSEEQEDFIESFYTAVVESLEVRYFVNDRLIGVSLIDACSRSWSSVYHFFDPDERHRSIGVLSVILEIQEAQRRGVPNYYLGYWVQGALTMQYKANYRPHEVLRGGAWIRTSIVEPPARRDPSNP